MTSSILHYVPIRLESPIQSWGGSAPWYRRASLSRPTKSGVVGLAANALGRDRRDDISDLAGAHFMVRVDRAGTKSDDLQTSGGSKSSDAMPFLNGDIATNQYLAKNPGAARYAAPRNITVEEGPLGPIAQAKWPVGDNNTTVSTREYIHDASFLALLGFSDRGLAQDVSRALLDPARPLSLGRLDCLPTATVHEGSVIASEHDGGGTPPAFLLSLDAKYPELALPERRDPYVGMFVETSLVAARSIPREDLEVYPEQPMTFASGMGPRSSNYRTLYIHRISDLFGTNPSSMNAEMNDDDDDASPNSFGPSPEGFLF